MAPGLAVAPGLPGWAPLVLKIGCGLLGAFVAAAMVFAVFEPIQVLPRLELAPGYALTDQHGDLVTSEHGRGAVTLYSFAPTGCETSSCRDSFATMASVAQRSVDELDLNGVEFRALTIALDPQVADSPDRLQAAADRSGADGEIWRWVGGSDTEVANTVGLGFGRFSDLDSATGTGSAAAAGSDTGWPKVLDGPVRFDGGYVIVDGNGVIRGDYRFQTLADDADKLLRHLNVLGQELRHQDGRTALAYEAAHLFLCYP